MGFKLSDALGLLGGGIGLATGQPWLGMAAGGALSSLFGEDEQTQRLNQILGQMQSSFPRMEQSIRDRGATNAAMLGNRIMDTGTAAGLPSNVLIQKLLEGNLGVQRNAQEQLGQLDLQKPNILSRMAQIIATMPQDTFGEDLMSTGLQGMMMGQLGTPGGMAWGKQQVIPGKSVKPTKMFYNQDYPV
jgi:hypothetical protein